MARKLPERAPAVGELVRVRSRQWLVEEVIEPEDRHFKAPIHARGEVSNGLVRMV